MTNASKNSIPPLTRCSYNPSTLAHLFHRPLAIELLLVMIKLFDCLLHASLNFFKDSCCHALYVRNMTLILQCRQSPDELAHPSFPCLSKLVHSVDMPSLLAHDTFFCFRPSHPYGVPTNEIDMAN